MDSLPTGNKLVELNDYFMNLTENQLCLEVCKQYNIFWTNVVLTRIL